MEVFERDPQFKLEEDTIKKNLIKFWSSLSTKTVFLY